MSREAWLRHAHLHVRQTPPQLILAGDRFLVMSFKICPCRNRLCAFNPMEFKKYTVTA